MPPVLHRPDLRQLDRMTSSPANTLAQLVSRQGLDAKTGPPGAQGPPGEATTFVFTEGAPSTVWTIKHDLKRFPSVTVIDTAGDEVQGITEYVSNNELKIVFSAAVTGTAYLN